MLVPIVLALLLQQLLVYNCSDLCVVFVLLEDMVTSGDVGVGGIGDGGGV